MPLSPDGAAPPARSDAAEAAASAVAMPGDAPLLPAGAPPSNAALPANAPLLPAGARPASRRRPAGPTLTVIHWRDIPAQVTARDRDRTQKWELHRRFQVAIDRAAVVAGLETYDRYIAEWRSASRPCGPDVAAELQAEVDRIDAAYPRDRLNALVANGGLATGSAAIGDPATDARTPQDLEPA